MANEPVHPNDMLTPREAAELLGVTTKTVGRWADRGLLACERTIGGHRRIRAATAYARREALEALRAAAPEPMVGAS